MRIGLTGGIASGKSTVAAWWQTQGALLVDTDALARELTQPSGAALPALAARFGAELLHPDQGLDRARMRALVLADAQARRDLEAILHPMIQQRADALARAAHQRGCAVVFDVPLLVESRAWRSQVDRVLLIDCEEAVQIERGSARPGWTEAQLRAVLAAQASRKQRRAAADACVDNSHIGLEQLHLDLARLASHWGVAPVPVEESRPCKQGRPCCSTSSH